MADGAMKGRRVKLLLQVGGETPAAPWLSEQATGGETRSGSSVYLLMHQARGFYLNAVLFSPFFPLFPPHRAALPSRTGGLSKCVLTAEVTLSARPDLGAVCLHLAAYLQMPGKRAKVIFCVWPAGKSEANDRGRVDCYLAPGIALRF